jgi:hypothetical protein
VVARLQNLTHEHATTAMRGFLKVKFSGGTPTGAKNLSSGVYFIKLIGNNLVESRKGVKE